MTTRYAVTCIGKDGLRVLFGGAQGRFMRLTREEAQAHLDAMIETNGEDRLVEIAGEQSRGTFRVDPFDCWHCIHCEADSEPRATKDPKPLA